MLGRAFVRILSAPETLKPGILHAIDLHNAILSKKQRLQKFQAATKTWWLLKKQRLPEFPELRKLICVNCTDDFVICANTPRNQHANQ